MPPKQSRAVKKGRVAKASASSSTARASTNYDQANNTISQRVNPTGGKLPREKRWLCDVDECYSGAYGFGEICKHYKKAHKDLPVPKQEDSGRFEKVPFLVWLNNGVLDYPATRQAKKDYAGFVLATSIAPIAPIPTTAPAIPQTQPALVPAKRSVKRKRDPTPRDESADEGRSVPSPAPRKRVKVINHKPAASEPPLPPPPVPEQVKTVNPEPAISDPQVASPARPKRVKFVNSYPAVPDPPEVHQISVVDRNWQRESIRLAEANERLQAALNANTDLLRRSQLQLEASRRVAEYRQTHNDLLFNENEAWQQVARQNDIDTTLYEDRTTLLNDAFANDPAEHQRILEEEAQANRRLNVRAYHTVRRQHQSSEDFFTENERVENWLANNDYELNDEPGSDDRSEIALPEYQSPELAQLNYFKRTEHREWWIVTNDILHGTFRGIDRAGKNVRTAVGRDFVRP